MKPLRFGMIGTGNIAPVHAAAIREVPDAKLVAVASTDCERREEFARTVGADCYDNYQELLARSDVDVISICTPHNLHLPMTQAAAQAGKHVLCEKPMAPSVEECDAMIDACRRAGVVLGVVFQSRFEPLTLQLKQMLDSGRLGRMIHTAAHTVWYRDDAYYRSAPWRGTWSEEGGGVLINQAIHTLDTLVWLGGLPTRVTAQMRTLNHDIEVEDLAVAILEYAEGHLGVVRATTAAFPGFPEALEFFGVRGGVQFHKGQARLEWRLDDPREDGSAEAEVSSGAARPMDITAAAHTAQYQDFAAAIRSGGNPSVDGCEGRRSIQLVEAIYRSAREGRPVAIGG